jgi:hypothetical protein
MRNARRQIGNWNSFGRGLFRPYRANDLFGCVTQGCALGYRITAFQA